jgi:outer membrane protein TolC
MRNQHEPRDQFVERLSDQIRVEIQRRNRVLEAPRWTRWLVQSPLKAAAAIAGLVIISMGIGGVVVAAAFQAQTNEQRSILIASYEQRAALAQQRLVIARTYLMETEQRVSVGLEAQEAGHEGRFKVLQAEAEVRSLELQIEEVRLTGREPLNAVSSPLVSGRDFVTERWKHDLSVSQAALALERERLRAAERRLAVGVGNSIDVETSKTRVIELEAAHRGMGTKLDIRQQFLKRQIDAPMADLRVLEAEAEQRRQTLLPRMELAQRMSKDVAQRVQTGTAQQVELLEAQLRLAQLAADLAKADMDIAMIRRQIDQRRAGK